MSKGRRWSQREDHARQADGRGDDARLVEGLRRRAPEALAGLHEQYAAGIYSLALRVVRHGPDAEDITQDVLIRAYERLPRDREVVLRPWLYRLTLNRCYDHLRWSSRRRFAAQEQETASLNDPYEQSEMQALLEATLGDLTRRQRAAILLKDVHGLSLVEVGVCLDLTPGSVEVLLARARRAFRASYEARCIAAGHPVPRSAGALAALPVVPLPLGLSAPPLALLAAPVPLPSIAPLVGGPLATTGGGAIGTLLGLPSSIKTAVVVGAAAASLGSGQLVATHADQRPPRPPARAAAAAAHPDPVRASAVEPTTRRPTPASIIASEPTSASDATPSPAPSVSATPSPQGDQLGIVSPSPSAPSSAAPDASPAATSSPDPQAATPSPSPTSAPSTSPSPSPGTGSPSPSSLPSPGL